MFILWGNSRAAILETSLRLGALPQTVHIDMFFWPSVSVCAHKRSSQKPLQEIYLLFFVKNLTKIIVSNWFEALK